MLWLNAESMDLVSPYRYAPIVSTFLLYLERFSVKAEQSHTPEADSVDEFGD